MKNIPTLVLGALLAVAAAAPAEAAPYHHGPSRPPGYYPGPSYPSHPGPGYRPGPVSPRERKEYRAQLRLRQLGYYHGRVDGSIGPVTQRAIVRFQRDHRLRMTGWLDALTLRALGVI